MSIHTQDAKIKVLKCVAQIRYSDGYRYMDRAGELLTSISNGYPDWVIQGFAPQTTKLRHISLPLVANVGVQALDVSCDAEQSLDGATKIIREFGDLTESLYRLVLATIDVGRTTRVGARFHFLAPADNLEEADRVVRSKLRSPFSEVVATRFSMELVDGLFHLVFENAETGARRSLTAMSVITDKRTQREQPLGFADDSRFDGGLLVDIDSFTRPDVGHMEKLSVFIQQEFTGCQNAAIDLIKWLVTPGNSHGGQI